MTVDLIFQLAIRNRMPMVEILLPERERLMYAPETESMAPKIIKEFYCGSLLKCNFCIASNLKIPHLVFNLPIIRIDFC